MLGGRRAWQTALFHDVHRLLDAALEGVVEGVRRLGRALALRHLSAEGLGRGGEAHHRGLPAVVLRAPQGARVGGATPTGAALTSAAKKSLWTPLDL